MINWLHGDIEPSDQRGQFAPCVRRFDLADAMGSSCRRGEISEAK